MHFVKMHGIGNDYVYVDAFTDDAIEHHPDLAGLSRRISDRHTGVGSDGLILICRPRSPQNHARMRMFNADGSESEMCGNGVRCVAKFAHDRLGLTTRPLHIETGRGVLTIDYTLNAGRVATATVDMGEPILDLPAIPVDATRLGSSSDGLTWRMEIGGAAHPVTFVSMGNPHVVFFMPRGTVAGLDLARIGPGIEHHAAFPRRINAHFVEIVSPREAIMRTWERGAGATLACGTGACAVLVGAARTSQLQREARLRLPGGDLDIRWDTATNHVFKTGPATDVFTGEYPE